MSNIAYFPFEKNNILLSDVNNYSNFNLKYSNFQNVM